MEYERADVGGGLNGSSRFVSVTRATIARQAALPVILIVALGTLFLAGRYGVLIDPAELERALATLSGSAWGLPVTVAVFLVGAYLGAPQFALFALAILTFGPWFGVAYAWAGTLCSGAATFWTGWLAGSDLVRRYGGARIEKVSRFMGRNAFAASAIVRNLPTAPFIIVNMTFGASEARFLPFLAGLALGSLPKLILVAVAHESAQAAGRGQWWAAVVLGLCAAAFWVGVALWARWRA